MNIEELRTYCIQKRAVEESFPFDDKTLVFKVGNKVFALMGVDWEDPAINLKCDPEKAIELREHYPQVKPGYHMNKKHWNTVYISDLPPQLLKEWVDHSYELIVGKLPKKTREELGLVISNQ